MKLNYLKIAWRILIKHKTLSVVNILGLSISIAFVLLMSVFIYNELNVNSIVKDNERVFLVQSKWKQIGQGSDVTTVAPLTKTLKDNYPNLVENFYHNDVITCIVSKSDKHFTEEIQIGDSTFLNIFGLELSYGDPSNALKSPNTVVITQAKAVKYFGKVDVVGQTLSIRSSSGEAKDFQITGVLKEMPYSTITNLDGTNQVDFFMSESNLKFFGRNEGFNNWGNVYIVNYIKLKAGVNTEDVVLAANKIIKSNCTGDISQNLQVYLTSLNDYYLLSNNGAAKKMIYGLTFVSFFILIMAVINYINITAGNSIARLKEIGVRKLLGGTKWQLTWQFISESTLLVLLSYIISILLFIIFRGFVSDVLGKLIPPFWSLNKVFIIVSLLAVLLIGTTASLYPAFVLSVQPLLQSLKGKLKLNQNKNSFLNGLVILQFVTAMVVFLAAIIIVKQINFFFNSDLGYDKSNIITATLPRDWSSKGVQQMETVRNEFMNSPVVESASFSFEIPDGRSRSSNNNIYTTLQDSVQGINAEILTTDENFAKTYQIPLIAGTFFKNKGIGADSANTVLNESALNKLGWKNPQDALGKQIRIQGFANPFTVEGILKDMHFGSMREAITPLFFTHVKNENVYRYMSIKIHPGNLGQSIAQLQKKWAQLLPGSPFEFVFIDDTLAKMYTSELRMKKACLLATFIALIIIFLGVLSMATLNLTKKVKEIGIRKVLGASALQIIWLFMKQFAILIIIAICFAWPIAYVALNNWLNNYAYKVTITVFPFLIVGLSITSFVAFIIIFKTFKTALKSPIKSLRIE